MAIDKKDINMIAVIGLGGFGGSLARSLCKMGKEVLAVDIDKDLVNEFSTITTGAAAADAADERVLKSLGIKNFDAVAVCMSDIESSICITLLCKQMGIPYVIAKAGNALHKTILEKIGADFVVFPEEYVGEKIASSIFNPTVLEIADLTDDFKIIEIVTPGKWRDKSLIELDIRKRHKVSILMIKRGDEVILNPGGDFVLRTSDLLIMCGGTAELGKLKSKATVAIPDDEIL
ncbi:MAG: TrkA family potassium uptake protein [Clostridiales bacterium]|jgi:trk system potassium uptake protein TrkA|nr:TrkA family potassium uptake protein [Clostridiales bacterium]